MVKSDRDSSLSLVVLREAGQCLQTVLVVLKLDGTVDWPWWVVWSPIWASALFLVTLWWAVR